MSLTNSPETAANSQRASATSIYAVPAATPAPTNQGLPLHFAEMAVVKRRAGIPLSWSLVLATAAASIVAIAEAQPVQER